MIMEKSLKQILGMDTTPTPSEEIQSGISVLPLILGLTILFAVLVLGCFVLYKYILKKGNFGTDFDNPVYRKTTEERIVFLKRGSLRNGRPYVCYMPKEVYFALITAIYCLPVPTHPDLLQPIKVVIIDKANLSELIKTEETSPQRFSYYIIRHIQDTLDREFNESKNNPLNKDSPSILSENKIENIATPSITERLRTNEKIIQENTEQQDSNIREGDIQTNSSSGRFATQNTTDSSLKDSSTTTLNPEVNIFDLEKVKDEVLEDLTKADSITMNSSLKHISTAILNPKDNTFDLDLGKEEVFDDSTKGTGDKSNKILIIPEEQTTLRNGENWISSSNPLLLVNSNLTAIQEENKTEENNLQTIKNTEDNQMNIQENPDKSKDKMDLAVESSIQLPLQEYNDNRNILREAELVSISKPENDLHHNVPSFEIIELGNNSEESDIEEITPNDGDFGEKITISSVNPVIVEDYDEPQEETKTLEEVPLEQSLPPAFYDQDLRASRTIHGGRLRLENSIPILSANRHKFGYVVDDTGFRKYRVEEKTPEGYIVGEYGVLTHDSGHLRGVKYAAHGSAHPRLIYEALLKFLSL
ncbi:uncharacterized protein LOC136030919 isoform X1 [Artemia franciscana]